VLKELRDLVGAKAAYERALKIDETALGPDHLDVASIISNLGDVLTALRDLVGAKPAYERALRIFKKFLPEGHPSIKIVQDKPESLSNSDDAN
jgi:hypothetical protein